MPAFGLHVDPELVVVLHGKLNKREALDQLVNALAARHDLVSDTDELRKAVFAREEVMSTGIGQGVAIPHVRVDSVKQPTIVIGISKEGIDFDTLDNEPVHILVLFAMPSGSQRVYLGLLAQVMLALKTPGFCEALVSCATPEEVLDLVNS
jgi:mannitol/fructose-specific phosphotransferase system IIA component (Ntr-type)